MAERPKPFRPLQQRIKTNAPAACAQEHQRFSRPARRRAFPNKLLGSSIRCFGYAVKFYALVLAVLDKKTAVKQAAFPLVALRARPYRTVTLQHSPVPL